MEQKNWQADNRMALVRWHLQEKKSWFLVSLAIMFITLLVAPMALNQRLDEAVVAIGLLEIATLVFISTMIDFSYFHDSRKLTYYSAKPVSSRVRLQSLLVSNWIYCAVLLLFLLVIAFLADMRVSELRHIFLVFIPWLFLVILAGALSAILTGNTIAAAVATIINFTLPLSVLGVLYFGFEIVGQLTTGFNTRVLFTMFTESIYRVDLLYFVRYGEEGFRPDFLLFLGMWIGVLYGLIHWGLARRKNERTGEFVVFDGYKSLVSVVFSSLVPIGFSSIFYNASMASKLASFVVLSGLTYYLIHAILEKNFRISLQAVKIYGVFITLFGLFILTTNLAAASFEEKVPEASQVRAVYLGSQSDIWLENENRMLRIYRASEEELEGRPGLMLYRDPETIANIIALQKEIIRDQSYGFHAEFAILYFLENGERMYRYYELRPSENYRGEKGSFFLEIANSDGWKTQALPFVYGGERFKDSRDIDLEIIMERRYEMVATGLSRYTVDAELLRELMRRDYDRLLQKQENILSILLFQRHNVFGQSVIPRETYDGYDGGVVHPATSYQVTVKGGKGGGGERAEATHWVTPEFTNTFAYLESLTRGQAGRSMEPVKVQGAMGTEELPWNTETRIL